MTNVDYSQLDAQTNGGVSATQRVGQLQSSGYGWMPLQTLYALVDSGLSDSDIRTTATRLTSSAVQADQANAVQKGRSKLDATGKLIADAQGVPNTGAKFSFKQFFDDPVLQKAPSAGLALKQYLSGAVGSWPVVDGNLAHQQQQLQIRGYGQGLPVDGKWDSAWDAAYQQYGEALYNSHLAGNGGGSTSLSTVMKGLSALQPTSAFDAVVGFVKSIPADMRDTLADFAGSVAGLGYGAIHPSELMGGKGHEAAHGAVSAAVINALGGDTTGQAEITAFKNHPAANLVRDLSTVYMLTGAMGVGSRLVDAIGGEAALAGTEAGAKLSADTAMHGPGVIARTLSSTEGTVAGAKISRGLIGAGLGAGAVTATGSNNPGEILAGAATGGLLGYLSASNALRNIPVLSNTGPVIDSLLDQDGLYYKARTLAATPYKYAPVRVAGDTFQDVTLLGAKARGLAALQSGPLGTDTAFSQGVQNEKSFSTLDDAIKHRLDFTILGAHIAPSLNDLQFFLHGPTETYIPGTSQLDEAGNTIPGTAIRIPEAKLSGIVGQSFNHLMTAYHDALTDSGVAGAWEHVTGRSTAQNIVDAGGLQNYNEFVGTKFEYHAANLLAQKERNDALDLSGLATEEGLSNADRLKDLQQRVSIIMGDSAKRSEATKLLRAQGNGAALENWVQRTRWETAVNNAGPKASEFADIPTYMDAVRLARRELQPRLGELVGEGQTASDRVLLNGVTDPGHFGIARDDTFTQQMAHQAVHDLEQEYAAIQTRVGAATGPETVIGAVPGVPVAELGVWNEKMDNLLKREFGIEPSEIPEAGAEKLAVAREHSKLLAVDVIPHPDAPPELIHALNELRGLGYKPVSGTGIGHIIDAPSTMDMAEGPLSFQRKVAERLGLNPDVYPNRTIAQTRKTGILNAGQKAIAKGDIVFNSPTWDMNTVLAALEKDGFVDQSPGYFKDLATRIARTPQRIAKANGLATDKETLAALEAEMNQALMLRDIPRKRFVDAFTDPEKFGQHFPNTQAELNQIVERNPEMGATLNPGNLPDVPLMSQNSAEALYAAIVKGSSDVPGYQLGAQKLEELFRSSLGFAGKGAPYRMGLGALIGAGAAYAVDPNDPTSILAGAGAGATLAGVGGDKLGWALANLPNKLIQARNEFRFELDPWFSLRRIAKINVKMVAEGVNPTVNPLKAMQQSGTLAEDKATLARIQPELHNAISDDADRYLQSQDVFGLYNHRNYEAYAAGQWARQGLADDQIQQKLVRTFEYGTGDIAGRSALERSANFVFFPFSFEKTVYRNLGSYLLDRPAQRVLLTRAMAAYDDFNKNHADNPLSTAFMKAHAPILQEAANLNMFTHGLSLGQPGGINRPLLNLFLPQSWSSSKDNLDKLKQFVPAVKNFSNLYNEVTQQGSILQNTGINMWRDLKGIPATYGNPAASTLTKSEQLTEAFTMQREWYTNYQAVIDHNAGTQDAAAKINFPLSAEWGRYAGEPITKTNIRKIIEGYYPAYSANGAIAAATTNSTNFQNYLLDTKGTPLHDYVQSFATNAHNLASGMNSNRFSGQDVANYTAALRTQAVYIAEQDPAFYRLYSSNFRKILGPLEKV